VVLQQLPQHLPAPLVQELLGLLRLAVAEPALDPAEITGQIGFAAARIAGAAASPDTRVLQELPAAVYGDGHRAGLPAAGTLATVTQLTPHAIAGFYAGEVRPAATTIVIAGDLTGLDPAALAEEAFAAWRDSRPAVSDSAPRPDPVPRRPPPAVQQVSAQIYPGCTFG
jgi:zinc protease